MYIYIVRYGDSANAKHIQNQLHGKEQDVDLKENMEKYPCTFKLKLKMGYNHNGIFDPF